MPAMAITKRTRCSEKYRRVPEASSAPATRRRRVPIQKMPSGSATEVPHLVSVSLDDTNPTVEKNDDRPTTTINHAASAA